MQFVVGTSGYSYPAWRKSFYPPKLPVSEMLGYYAQHFAGVEINNSFYRLPQPSVLESWAEQVPRSFRFALKAPQMITHRKRLNNVRAETAKFLRVAAVLRKRLGPLLFQLPPNFKKDLPRLQRHLAFLRVNKIKAAVEFRHASWFDDDVFTCLRAHGCALCIADADELPQANLVSTARWGYLRLRREAYSRKRLMAWIEGIRAQPWSQAYVFFKHEDTGTGPKLARQFLTLAEAKS